MDEKKQKIIERYIQNIKEEETLRDIARLALSDENWKEKIIECAIEFDNAFPLMEGDGSGYLEDE